MPSVVEAGEDQDQGDLKAEVGLKWPQREESREEEREARMRRRKVKRAPLKRMRRRRLEARLGWRLEEGGEVLRLVKGKFGQVITGLGASHR